MHSKRKRRGSFRSLLASIAVGASVSAQTADASCAFESSTVVRGRFIRCENAQFYWDASGGDRAVLESIERELSYGDPRSREQRRARILEGLPEGPLGPRTKSVAVVSVEWRATTTPWQPGISTTIELVSEPRELGETVRYFWRGPPEACNATSGSFVDLWVTYPCCDTPFLVLEEGCLTRINYAEPAPAPMREVLAKALAGR